MTVQLHANATQTLHNGREGARRAKQKTLTTYSAPHTAPRQTKTWRRQASAFTPSATLTRLGHNQKLLSNLCGLHTLDTKMSDVRGLSRGPPLLRAAPGLKGQGMGREAPCLTHLGQGHPSSWHCSNFSVSLSFHHTLAAVVPWTTT